MSELTKETFLGCLINIAFLLAGCGSGAVKPTSEQVRAFDAAPAEVRQIWDKALGAERVKDYVTAQTLLKSLFKMDLTSKERDGLNAEYFSFQHTLYQSAEKGDPLAIKAVKEIQQNDTR